MNDDAAPTLTDAKGSGGLVAQSGFDYQIWEALVRLPGWLQNPAFEEFIIEGLEDFEARFFTPYAPERHILDRFQAKEGALAKADITSVFSSFLKYTKAYPGTVRVQTLVTPTLPTTLRWIARDQNRVQRARPFYKPFATVVEASEAKFRDDLIAEFGVELATFVAENVDISLRTHTNIDAARLAFAHALDVTFPELDATPKRVKAAFDALVTLAGEKRGTAIKRVEALHVLETAISAQVIDDRPLPVHIRSDRDVEQARIVEIDASKFAGGATGFPEPSEWQELMAPLAAVADWAHLNRHHRIRLSGSYRLSTAFAIGHAFRAAKGFDLEVPSRGTFWGTDDHSQEDGTRLGWQAQPYTGLVDGRLVVAVGVIRDPVQDVLVALGLTDQQHVLHLQLDRAILSAKDTQAAVQYIKGHVAQAVSTYRPDALDLFFVGPATLAVALGHRWNAFPPTQWYEFQAGSGTYMPTCRIQ